MHTIHGKFRALKVEVRKCVRIKKIIMIKELLGINKELEKLDKILDNGNPSPDLIKKYRRYGGKQEKDPEHTGGHLVL